MRAHTLLVAIGLWFSIIACENQELPPLGENLYDQYPELIVVDFVSFENYSNLRVNVRLSFDSKYNQLPLTSQNSIESIEIFRDNRLFQIPKTQDRFFDPQRRRGQETCYRVRFLLNSGERTPDHVACITTPE